MKNNEKHLTATVIRNNKQISRIYKIVKVKKNDCYVFRIHAHDPSSWDIWPLIDETSIYELVSDIITKHISIGDEKITIGE